MADSTISGLNPGAPAQLIDELPIEREGLNYKLNLENLKSLIGPKSYDEGITILDLDSDTTLTELSAILPVNPSASGFKVLLPEVSYIREKLSIGGTFQVLNVNFEDKSFELCYADGTLIKIMEPLEGLEFMIQKSTTQGEDMFPYPNVLFMLSKSRGEVGGLFRVFTDDIYDNADQQTHLLSNEGLDYLYSNPPVGTIAVKGQNGWTTLQPGNQGEFLQSQGAGTVPTYVAADIPPAVINTFNPNLIDQEFQLINPQGFYSIFGKTVFIHMTFEFPEQQDTDTTVIGGLPATPNSTMPSQVGTCMAVSPTINNYPCYFKAISGTSTGTIVLQGFEAKNQILSGAKVTVTMQYFTD